VVLVILLLQAHHREITVVLVMALLVRQMVQVVEVEAQARQEVMLLLAHHTQAVMVAMERLQPSQVARSPTAAVEAAAHLLITLLLLLLVQAVQEVEVRALRHLQLQLHRGQLTQAAAAGVLVIAVED
jgi:hypothetical protein